MCKLYEKLWKIWPGRRWTYAIRDWWHQYEGLWIVGLIAIGALACWKFGLLSVLKALAIFASGYVAGHVFWGKDWGKGQEHHLYWGKEWIKEQEKKG